MKYRDVIRQVLASKLVVPTPQGQYARTAMQQTMSYDLGIGEFPVITERSLKNSWRKAIGELCAFINGATTIKEIEEFGCDWWRPWASIEKTSKRGLEPDSLGPASYGGAFRYFPDGEGGPGFDQFANLVVQLRRFPEVRTHFVTPWIPYGQVRGSELSTIAPCHGWIHVRIINRRLYLHMFQRSGDVPVGVPHNMVQYAALMLMLSQLTGYQLGTYYHTISDAHIYDNQEPAAKIMLSRDVRKLPYLHLNPKGMEVKDIHDFRAEHFNLLNYNPHPGLMIPVAV